MVSLIGDEEVERRDVISVLPKTTLWRAADGQSDDHFSVLCETAPLGLAIKQLQKLCFQILVST